MNNDDDDDDDDDDYNAKVIELGQKLLKSSQRKRDNI